jgi:hypothetical protein
MRTQQIEGVCNCLPAPGAKRTEIAEEEQGVREREREDFTFIQQHRFAQNFEH